MSSADPRSRRVALALLVLVACLFVVELVALALGNGVLAGICAALFVLAWFPFRSWQKRRERS